MRDCEPMYSEARRNGRGIRPTTGRLAIVDVTNVQLDNGTRRSFSQGSNPPFRESDRVKVVDGRLALLAK